MAKILYVEDHPPAQMLMQAIIADMTPHQLKIASTGEEACKIVKTFAPNLYIIDLDLPDTDGITLAKAIFKMCPSPVLLVSAYAEAVKDSSLDGVITAYLAKPLDPEHVAEAIERTLA
jgi:two-component system, LytTR family, response regulator AlgR